MDFSNKILSDPVNKWIFATIKKDIYLVGGYMRDLLLGRKSRDKDFVLKGNVEEAAKKTAVKFKGTFIVLKKNHTCRVALKDNSFIDFSQIFNNILEDLSKRDYTINAIAWSPETGMIEPFENIRDIHNKIIRNVNPENLKNDPLRILRAYRLAAQLNFRIDITTRKYLKEYSSLITKAAPERITEEIIRLLNSENSHIVLKLCNKDNVLHNIIRLSHHILTININNTEKFDCLLFKLNKDNKLQQMLNADISQGLKTDGLIRLSLLLKSRNAADLNFFNQHLRFSNLTIKKLNDIYGGYQHCRRRLTGQRLFKIFNTAHDSAYETAIILSVLKNKNIRYLLNRAYDFMKIKNKPLIRGNEIQKIIKIKPGPIIGVVQGKILEGQFLGFIRTKAEAKRWIKSNLT